MMAGVRGWGGGSERQGEWDKGLACVISRYTNSIKEYSMIDCNCVCIQETFLRF